MLQPDNGSSHLIDVWSQSDGYTSSDTYCSALTILQVSWTLTIRNTGKIFSTGLLNNTYTSCSLVPSSNDCAVLYVVSSGDMSTFRSVSRVSRFYG